MQNWQNLMLKGNRCYMEENWQHAEFYYREAEDVLNAQWFADQASDELLMAWICANHNLATLFETTGHYREALKYLLQPHERLTAIVRAKTSCNAIKTVAIKALSKTLEPINLFKKKHNVCEECVATLLKLSATKAHRNAIIH